MCAQGRWMPTKGASSRRRPGITYRLPSMRGAAASSSTAAGPSGMDFLPVLLSGRFRVPLDGGQRLAEPAQLGAGQEPLALALLVAPDPRAGVRVERPEAPGLRQVEHLAHQGEHAIGLDRLGSEARDAGRRRP